MIVSRGNAWRGTVAILIGSLAWGGNGGAGAQQFRSHADLVRVEVVTRDSAGRPLVGLAKQQFRIFEDGKSQDIAVFVEVRGNAPPTGQPAPKVAPDPQAEVGAAAAAAVQPSFVAVVVDRMSPEARAFVARALAEFVESSNTLDYIGLFSSDGGLRTVQTFTRDRLSLKAAIYQISMTPSTQFGRDHERSNASTPDAHPSVPVVASAESAGRPTTAPGESQEAAALAALGSSNSWEVLARNQQGYASTDALLALTAILGRIEGRKSVVLFADHLSIPDAVLPRFNSVVSTANQSQVSVYTIDTAGLRVHSGDAETGREVRAIGEAGLKVNSDGSTNSSLSLMERNEDVLRKDPRTSLTLLANRTGGEFTGNTNDLGRGLKRVSENQRFYYVLGYVPKGEQKQAGWRQLEVTVEGVKATINHRQGYLGTARESHSK